MLSVSWKYFKEGESTEKGGERGVEHTLHTKEFKELKKSKTVKTCYMLVTVD